MTTLSHFLNAYARIQGLMDSCVPLSSLCVAFYQQISGRKQWAIYYENELVRAGPDFEHGANYRSNLVYYGTTQPGDVLMFYPWAAHAAKVHNQSTSRTRTTERWWGLEEWGMLRDLPHSTPLFLKPRFRLRAPDQSMRDDCRAAWPGLRVG